MKKKIKVAFLSGLPRSGSTLLLNILAQNPKINVTGTSGLVELCTAMRQQFSQSVSINAQPKPEMDTRFKAACKGAIEGWAGISTSEMYIDKNRSWPTNIEFLESVGIKPKIIITVRDLRAVLSSMEKLYRQNSLRIDPVTNAQQQNAGTTEGRIQAWGGGTPIGVAANEIKDIFTRKLESKVHFVKFEDLTTNPVHEIEVIYKYLGMDNYNHNFNSVSQVTHEDDRLHGIPNLHNIRPIVGEVEEDWEDILGKALSDQIPPGARWFYELFYPEGIVPELSKVESIH